MPNDDRTDAEKAFETALENAGKELAAAWQKVTSAAEAAAAADTYEARVALTEINDVRKALTDAVASPRAMTGSMSPGPRLPCRRRRLLGQCRESSCPDARTRRHRRHGLSRVLHPRAQGVQKQVRILFSLPPRTPGLKPIKQAFARLKNRMRKAAARCGETLWRNVGDIRANFKPDKCANYFRNA